jgi:hypothetical protein
MQKSVLHHHKTPLQKFQSQRCQYNLNFFILHGRIPSNFKLGGERPQAPRKPTHQPPSGQGNKISAQKMMRAALHSSSPPATAKPKRENTKKRSKNTCRNQDSLLPAAIWKSLMKASKPAVKTPPIFRSTTNPEGSNRKIQSTPGVRGNPNTQRNQTKNVFITSFHKTTKKQAQVTQKRPDSSRISDFIAAEMGHVCV